jgi:hypothetical protein
MGARINNYVERNVITKREKRKWVTTTEYYSL